MLQDVNNPTGYSQVLEEYVNGTFERSYIIGQRVEGQTDGTDTQWIVSDGHGSTRAVVDQNGDPGETYDYDAYGNVITAGFDPNSTDILVLYTNQLFDPVLGQYVLRARYYDPSIGRFSSFDSYEGDAGSPRTLHKYLYANTNPIHHIDPSGHMSLPELGIGNLIQTTLNGLQIVGVYALKRLAARAAFSLGFAGLNQLYLSAYLPPVAHELRQLANAMPNQPFGKGAVTASKIISFADYIDDLWVQQTAKNVSTSVINIGLSFWAPAGVHKAFRWASAGVSALGFANLMASIYEPLHLIHQTLQDLGDIGIYIEQVTTENLLKLSGKAILFQLHPEEYIAQLRVAVVAAREGDFSGSQIAMKHLVQTLRDDYGEFIR